MLQPYQRVHSRQAILTGRSIFAAPRYPGYYIYVLRYVLLVRVQVLLSTYRYIQYGIRSSIYSTEYVLVHTSTVYTEMVCVGERGTVCECDFDDA